MSEVDWEGMRPPTRQEAAPPVSDAPSWAPITAPVAVVPPPSPPAPMPPAPSWPPAPGAPTPRGRGRQVVAGMIVAVLLLGGGFVFARATEDSRPDVGRAAVAVANSGSTATVDPNAEEPIAAVAAAVSPAVVQIETHGGLGAGFIYDADGHILTAAHVIEGATSTANVRLADGSVHKGEIIGSDAASDVAVLKIDPVDNMQIANLATGVKVLVGQTAVAIGSPFGLDQTVTAGIVSAVGRPLETTGGAAIDMYQIDAPINPGNSGGPVADRQGRVFGIADQIVSPSGENIGLGFLVPIDLAKAVADKLVAGEPVEFAFIGVSTDSQSSTRLTPGDGAVVVGVTSGSPAEKAGLQEGDRITAVDSSPVHDDVDLRAHIRSHQPGDTVHVTFVRDGQTQTIEVQLGSTKTR